MRRVALAAAAAAAAVFAVAALMPHAAPLPLARLTLCGAALGAVKLVVGRDGRATRALVLGFLLAASFGALLLLRHGRAAGTRALPLAPFLAIGSLLALIP